MLTPANSLFFLLSPANADAAANRRIAAPCALISEKAVQYLEEHDFYTSRKTEGDGIVIELGSDKDASTPSGKPLALNRFSIHKYTLHRHLSPLKAYENFRLKGHLSLTKAAEGACNVTLSFEVTAYEYVWALGMIDDGYESKFVSNGTLERLYIEPINDLFIGAKR